MIKYHRDTVSSVNWLIECAIKFNCIMALIEQILNVNLVIFIEECIQKVTFYLLYLIKFTANIICKVK